MAYFNKLKNFIKHFFLIDDSPHKVAAGAALGIFMGIVPGEGVISSLVLATIFRFNRLAAAAGVLASNMWTTLLVLPLAAFIGGIIFHVNPQGLIESSKETLSAGFQNFFSFTILFKLVIPLMVGYIIAAIIISLVFYFLLYFLLKHKKLKFK